MNNNNTNQKPGCARASCDIDKKHGIGRAKAGSTIVWHSAPGGPMVAVVPKKCESSTSAKTYRESRMRKKGDKK